MELYAASYLVPISSPPVAGGALAVDNGRIVDTGTFAELRARYGCPVHDFPGCTILPGLVNAHTHLELTHFPSWKIRKGIDYSPRTYVDWIIQVIKIRRALTRQELELSVREGLRICLEAGTTSIGEILTDRSLLPLYADSGLGGRLFLEAIGHDPVRSAELISELGAAVASFPAGDLLPGLSPHAPHTVSEQLHQNVRRLAEEYNVPRIIHLAESREESDFFFDSTGKIAELLYSHVRWESYLPAPRRATATAWLDGLGVLNGAISAVHCVHLTPSDAETLAKRGVGIVLCPRSNEKLAVGRAPVAYLKKLGIPLALGTDSLASNDSLSLWDEMRYLLDLFPGVFTPSEALAMATIGSARQLALADRVGSIEKGKRADLLVMKLPGPQSTGEGLHEAVIGSGELLHVILSGRFTDRTEPR
ncbi:amidohydrolase family protein [Geobacter sulfurreducens]|jgi:cytosine/adenosine deaminase-related metal-dependent hydrolase|uniref:amidohydrolase family protein n=1 Tax=Geobacter sulfurreducens TaxID=35554 RepID=UPI0001D8F044|nr:amidohydrolase family protein [Geobacter sulfurreducens]ADI84545.1 metal-dependent hydrolase, subgroup D [Geobacter sulfurreducens KN400]AJY71410.1 metal-dependent hydrolase [Geobacter sulfurreducens]UTG94337.1 amidohydrolase family protein [Geobacter sulfurreducens]